MKSIFLVLKSPKVVSRKHGMVISQPHWSDRQKNTPFDKSIESTKFHWGSAIMRVPLMRCNFPIDNNACRIVKKILHSMNQTNRQSFTGLCHKNIVKYIFATNEMQFSD